MYQIPEDVSRELWEQELSEHVGHSLRADMETTGCGKATCFIHCLDCGSRLAEGLIPSPKWEITVEGFVTITYRMEGTEDDAVSAALDAARDVEVHGPFSPEEIYDYEVARFEVVHVAEI